MTTKIEVRKRDNSIVPYSQEKITKAVLKALVSTDEIPAPLVSGMAQLVADAAEKNMLALHSGDANILTSVEELQDLVEQALMKKDLPKTAKAYILYRKQHEKLRNTKSCLLDVKKQVEDYIGPEKDWRVKENSTVTNSLGGLILGNSGAITANYWLNEVYDQEIADAHKNADIHIHDLSMLSGYCAGWSLKQLIQEGIGGVEGRITSAPAKHLSTLCNQMVNFLGIMQNEWAGKIYLPA